MTVAMLMVNTLQSARYHYEKSCQRSIKPLKLNILTKVPRYDLIRLLFLVYISSCLSDGSDIEIAQAQTPKPIADLATELGLRPNELESYGKYKAKVELSVLERLAHRKNGKYIVISGLVAFRINHQVPFNQFSELPPLRLGKASRLQPLVLPRPLVPTYIDQHLLV